MLNNTNTYTKCENRFSIENIFKTIYCYIATSVWNLTAITCLYPQSHCICLPSHNYCTHIYSSCNCTHIAFTFQHPYIYIYKALAFLHQNSYCISAPLYISTLYPFMHPYTFLQPYRNYISALKVTAFLTL